MKEQLLDKLPKWYKDINKDKYYLILSNDMDSYLSCCLLHKLLCVQIGAFFDTYSGLYINAERTQGKEPIGVDLALTHGKCFDNHMTFVKNPECINPNVITTTYNKKYNGSTFAMLLSLYNRPIAKYNDKQRMAVIVVDNWERGYYKQNGKYKDVNIYWLQMLSMDTYLLPVLQAHTQDDFNVFEQKYNADAKISIVNNHLYCKHAKLPQCNMHLTQSVEPCYISKSTLLYIDINSIITAAETYKDKYAVSHTV